MLSNMAGTNSEMNAISLYIYNSLITEPEYKSFAACFENIAIVEMHHLDIFGQIALQIGADPRLWAVNRNKKQYWSPGYNNYPREIKEVLRNSIDSEKAAIEKYTAQAQSIRDTNIVENLNRIILDERRHLDVFTKLYTQI